MSVGVITQGKKQKVSSSSEEGRCKNPGHEKTRRDNYVERDIIAVNKHLVTKMNADLRVQ